MSLGYCDAAPASGNCSAAVLQNRVVVASALFTPQIGAAAARAASADRCGSISRVAAAVSAGGEAGSSI